MTRDELIDEIFEEIERVWGERGPGGSWDEYVWLFENYDITDVEDIQWMEVLDYCSGELDDDDLDDEDKKALMDFVTDDATVISFLQILLQKYRSNNVSFPDDAPTNQIGIREQMGTIHTMSCSRCDRVEEVREETELMDAVRRFREKGWQFTEAGWICSNCAA